MSSPRAVRDALQDSVPRVQVEREIGERVDGMRQRGRSGAAQRDRLGSTVRGRARLVAPSGGEANYAIELPLGAARDDGQTIHSLVMVVRVATAVVVDGGRDEVITGNKRQAIYFV